MFDKISISINENQKINWRDSTGVKACALHMADLCLMSALHVVVV